MKVLIYDCEIKQAIKNKGEQKAFGIHYCKGWGDFKGMGISCICAYDQDGRSYVFLKDNFSEFQQMIIDSDLMIGFGSDRFDRKLLEANNFQMDSVEHYDFKDELIYAMGQKVSPKSMKGRSLGAIAEANSIPGKTGEGAMAPIDWQRRKFGTVINYCMHDARMLYLLFMNVWADRMLVDPVTKKNIFLKNPRPDDDPGRIPF